MNDGERHGRSPFLFAAGKRYIMQAGCNHRASFKESEQLLKERNVYQGRIFTVWAESAKLPDGRIREYDVVRHPGGSAVVAVDAAMRVCLIKQWRHAVNGWIVEIPAGKLDVAGESPQKAALRELKEEAGIQAGNITPLGTILSTPGFSDEVLHLFLATDLKPGETSHEAGEFIEVFWTPFKEALGMAQSGVITDAKTVAGLFRASALVGKERRFELENPC